MKRHLIYVILIFVFLILTACSNQTLPFLPAQDVNAYEPFETQTHPTSEPEPESEPTQPILQYTLNPTPQPTSIPTPQPTSIPMPQPTPEIIVITQECFMCEGTGDCFMCGGDGKLGSWTCDMCRRDTGNCYYCNGTGVITTTVVNTHTDNAVSENACNICKGSGVCQVCFGKGGMHVPTYGQDTDDWVVCAGCKGNRKCKYCHGTGID